MKNEEKINNIIIENARITWRNFKGEVSKKNPSGEKNFGVRIDDLAMVEALIKDGWNIKHAPKDRPVGCREDDKEYDYLPVAVSWDNDYYIPEVVMFTNDKKKELSDKTVGVLDRMNFENVDIIIRPYVWDVNGKTGVKAYVKNLYVTVTDSYNPFADKYARYDGPDVDLPFEPD